MNTGEKISYDTPIYMQGHSGTVSITEPKIALRDITHGLSQICRYVGACDEFWSVGQHILLCETLTAVFPIAKEFRLPLLLHDAAEYILNDQNGVYKSKLGPWFESSEKLVEAAVAKKFGFDPELFHSNEVKLIDAAALFVESHALFSNRIPELWLALDDRFSNTAKLNPYIAALKAAKGNFPTMPEVSTELCNIILAEIAS